MPELPEVETLVRQWAPSMPARILDVRTSSWPQYASAAAATGATLQGLRRHGKLILGALDNDHTLLIHLGMTGQLLRSAEGLDHVHVSLHLEASSGPCTLHFRDPRRFGRFLVVPDHELADTPRYRGLGPDALDPGLAAETLHRKLQRTRRPLKVVLLDQTVVAGLGNYLVDEICWRAGIDPHRPAADLRLTDTERLLTCARLVIQESIAAGGNTLRDYVHADGSRGSFADQLAVYGLAGAPCQRCGSHLASSRIGGRGTTWCPSCQT